MMHTHKNTYKTLTQKTRLLLVILLLGVGLNAATPRQAHASGMAASWGVCALTAAYPALFNACTAIASSAIAQAIASVIENHMQGLVTRIQILTGARIAEAQMTNAQRIETVSAEAENTIRTDFSVGRASCAADTAVGVLVGGLGGSGGSGGGTGGGGPAPRPDPEIEVGVRGNNIVIDRLSCPDGVAPSRCQNELAARLAAASLTRQTSNVGSAAGAILDHQNAEQFRGEASEDPEAPVPYADITARSIFATDSFEGETEAARAQRAEEAAIYCTNLIMPGNSDRVGGSNTSDRHVMQAAERANDARILLAKKACDDAIARRAPITYNAENPTYDWIVNAACSYRRAMTARRDEERGGRAVTVVTSTLHASGFDGASHIERAMNAACPVTPDAGAPVNSAGTGAHLINFSRLELFRILSSDLFGTAQGAMHIGSSNVAELQRMLISMETIGTQMNMEMLRMQEQLNLLEAASLAADIRTR